MTAHKTHSHEDAELWNLAFWQKQGSEARLSALVSLRNDLAKVEAERAQL